MFIIDLPEASLSSLSGRTVFADYRRTLRGGRGRLLITCAGKYKLYVNGTYAASGPARGDDRHSFYDDIDLAPYLTREENTVCVRVASYPELPRDPYEYGPTHTMIRGTGPALVLGGDAAGDAADWNGRVASSLCFRPGPSEYTGAGELLDETVPVPEYAPVRSCGEAGPNNYGEFFFPMPLPRPIPPFLEKEGSWLCAPELVTKGAAGEAVWEASKLITGFFRAQITAPKGARVTFTYSECTWFNENGRYIKRVRDDRAGIIRGLTDEFVSDGRPVIFEPFHMRTFRFVRINVEETAGPVRVSPLPYLETRYPLGEKASLSFSDERMKKLWRISMNTLENCMHDSYEDCPYYEQLQYSMDTRLEILYTYAVGGDTRLAAKAVDDFSHSLMPNGLLCSRYPSARPQIIPGFSLYWILMTEDLYNRTGDISYLTRYLPTILSVAGAFRRNIGKTGLVGPMGRWDFADWTDRWGDRAGVPTAVDYGPSTIQNLLYAYALASVCRILRTVGWNDAADDYEKVRRCILENIETLCWDEARGMYREGPTVNEYTRHAQIWAVLNSLAEGDKAVTAMEHALDDPDVVRCSFVMNYYLYRALEKAGLYKRTIALWNEWYRLLELNCTTVPETPEETPRSECHAWGALALYEYPRVLLGLRSLVPGEGKLILSPANVDIPAMSGTLPTVWGDVTVSRETVDGHVRVAFTVPAGSEIYRAGKNGTLVHLEGSGTFDIAEPVL